MRRGSCHPMDGVGWSIHALQVQSDPRKSDQNLYYKSINSKCNNDVCSGPVPGVSASNVLVEMLYPNDPWWRNTAKNHQSGRPSIFASGLGIGHPEIPKGGGIHNQPGRSLAGSLGSRIDASNT